MRARRANAGPPPAPPRRPHRRHPALGALVPLVISVVVAVGSSPGAAQAACPPGWSEVACENQRPGSPPSEWEISGLGDDSIVGFTTDISVNAGSTVRFKVSTPAPAYTIDVYRMGYYQGNGARRVATLTPSASAQNQPPCLSDASTGLVDCGNWRETASWTVPANAVSGIYFARIERTDTGGDNHIVFVVRDDASTADLLFQTSDTTWQAYNTFGGNSFYQGSPAGRAFKLSYNRPVNTRKSVPFGQDYVWANEYPMVRWLERNGYDLTYQSGIDTDRLPLAELTEHKAFLSVGHDEYWTGVQRTKVEAARDAGTHLAFFSGNEVYWKGRLEPGIDGSGTPNRTWVSYKETWSNAKIDPSPEWTGTWRDPRFSPPSDGGRPENQLTGTMYAVNCCNKALQVPAADGRMRLWRNTPVATQPDGATATLAANTVGYEFDITPDNGFQPPGLVKHSTTSGPVSQYLYDYGSIDVRPGEATHHVTLYKAPSGALVFGAGTVQWSWGLDENHDGLGNPPQDRSMQQATLNLLADMGAGATTRQADLVAATASTDTTGPTVAITSPTAGATLTGLTQVTIAGTATDNGGGRVGGVEVSTDNGATWHPATGRSPWSYTWTVTGAGSRVIRVRAADDSGNIGPAASRTVQTTCPCTIFGGQEQFPAAANDSTSLTLGVKFRSDVAGFVTGVRFYKGPGNTGTHVGSLWSATGTRLAQATFTGETSSGWQTVTFATPVAVQANTTYVASYTAPNGHYVAHGNAFASSIDMPPLHALADGTDGPNGVFALGDAFPTLTFGRLNYGVDVVLTTNAPNDTTPPTATIVAPPAGATSVPTTTTVRARFNEPVQPSTITFTLQAGTTPVPGSTSWDPATTTATFTPTAPLAPSTAHTARVSGARDLAGNAMAGTVQSGFTTAAVVGNPGGCPCTLWPDPATPAVAAADDGAAVELGMRFRADTSGTVTGVRFYKGPGNTGTHTGRLWTTNGTLLASVTFTNETTTGWQQATFASPVAVTANTTYVVSYHAPNGRYAVNVDQFAGTGVDRGPLHAPADGANGPNGVYRYGPSGFPTFTYRSANYWVDVVFEPGAPPPPPTCPCTVFPAGASPAVSAADDTAPVELGMRVRADTAGTITALRFYKGPGNTGTHTARLWSATGTQLASVTFTNETASGWQEATLPTPVAITAGTTYVVSYHAPNGRYAVDQGYFASSGADNGPLHAPASTGGAPNGVYRYGATPGFPDQTYLASNYWVDVRFTPQS